MPGLRVCEWAGKGRLEGVRSGHKLILRVELVGLIHPFVSQIEADKAGFISQHPCDPVMLWQAGQHLHEIMDRGMLGLRVIDGWGAVRHGVIKALRDTVSTGCWGRMAYCVNRSLGCWVSAWVYFT
jgi:hypothetical protein